MKKLQIIAGITCGLLMAGCAIGMDTADQQIATLLTIVSTAAEKKPLQAKLIKNFRNAVGRKTTLKEKLSAIKKFNTQHNLGCAAQINAEETKPSTQPEKTLPADIKTLDQLAEYIWGNTSIAPALITGNRKVFETANAQNKKMILLQFNMAYTLGYEKIINDFQEQPTHYFMSLDHRGYSTLEACQEADRKYQKGRASGALAQAPQPGGPLLNPETSNPTEEPQTPPQPRSTFSRFFGSAAFKLVVVLGAVAALYYYFVKEAPTDETDDEQLDAPDNTTAQPNQSVVAA